MSKSGIVMDSYLDVRHGEFEEEMIEPYTKAVKTENVLLDVFHLMYNFCVAGVKDIEY